MRVGVAVDEWKPCEAKEEWKMNLCDGNEELEKDELV